jgi:hypothetical protein
MKSNDGINKLLEILESRQEKICNKSFPLYVFIPLPNKQLIMMALLSDKSGENLSKETEYNEKH